MTDSVRRRIDGWGSLTWKELLYMASRGYIGGNISFTDKVEVWLHLHSLKIESEDEAVVFLGEKENEPLLLSQKKRWGKRQWFSTNVGELMDVVKAELAFMDTPSGTQGGDGLTALPREKIRIGHRTFMLPAPLLANITYQQYSNAVKLMKVTEGMTDAVKDIKPDTARLSKEQAAAVLELELATARVVSHLLTPRSLRLTGGDGRSSRISIGWEYAYTPEAAEANVDYIRRHAPKGLFAILAQHLHSCLAVYQKQYPDMFSGGSGDDDRLPFIAEADSVNAVMKWQSYSAQQEVYDSNAVFIFSILSAMAKESKELEKLNSKTRGR